MSLKVETIKIEVDKQFKDLVPKYPHYYTVFTVDTNYVYANGIRRVISNSIPLKRMWFERENFKTTDKRLIPEFIQSRIRSIPVEQLDLNINLSLNVKNNTDEIMEVTTEHLKGNPLPKMNKNIICELQPKQSLTITNIKFVSAIGREDGRHVETSGCASVQNGDNYDIKFFSNGMVHPKELINTAIEIMIDKFKRAKTLLNDIVEYPPPDLQPYKLYRLKIKGEDDTVGSMIMRSILDIYPEILHVSYDLDETTVPTNILLYIRCKDDNAISIIESSCDNLINLLKSYLQK